MHKLKLFVFLGVSGAICSPVAAATVIDGAISASDGWTEILSDPLNDVQVFVASDANNLYFGGSTPDDDDGKANLSGFDDAFNINFGLDGNAAAWRYRLLSQNAPFNDNGGPSTPLDGVWEGFLQGGDDSIVGNAQFGVPGNLTNLDATQVDYAVALNGGRREHEFAIPWTLLLDGQNGWDTGTPIDLRIGGFFAADGVGFGFGTSPIALSTSGSTIDYGDQNTYASISLSPTGSESVISGGGTDTSAAIPVSAALPLMASGLVTLGALARRRDARA